VGETITPRGLWGTFYLLVVTRYLKWKVFVLSPNEMKINALLSKAEGIYSMTKRDGSGALIN